MFGIYINYFYIKNCPKLELSKKGVLIKNNYYEWAEIKEIVLTGKTSILNVNVECLTFVFNDNSVHKIIDEFYSNSNEIKLFIERVIILQNDDLEKKSSTSINVDIERELFIRYKGNPLFTFNGIAIWILILMILYYSANNDFSTLENKIASISIILLGSLLLSNMSYYFKISKNYLVVKNHYFFWIKKVYYLREIREIVFETQTNQSDKLRVITNNFKSKVFQANTLSNKTWLEMKKELESKNIKVRNECIPE